jgi:hypothetical protein
MPLAAAIFGVRDYSGEMSNISFEMDVPADGTAYAAQATLVDALALAIKAVTIGNLNWYGTRYVQNDELGSPANAFAQRELGLQLYWRETTGDDPDKGVVTIPAPDLSIVAQPETDDVDLTVAIVAALVAAIEATWNGTLAVNREIYRGRIVGRKS